MSSEQKDLAKWQPRPIPAPLVLEGHWVTLAPLSAVHHGPDLWNSVRGHDEVWDWLGDGPYSAERDMRIALAAKEAGTAAARFFAILPKSTHRGVPAAKGYASLMRMDPANGVIEVGNVMFSPALQRTAAATEAMYLMARYVFEELGYRRYEWKCNALNHPSRRAAERLGFTFEGIFRQHMVIKGKNRDTAWFAMLDAEWPMRKAAFETWLAPENFDAQGQQRFALQELAQRQALP